MPVGKPLRRGYQAESQGATRGAVHIAMPELPLEEPVIPEIVPAIPPDEPKTAQEYQPEEIEQQLEEIEAYEPEEVEEIEEEVQVARPAKKAQESFREIREAKERAEYERNTLMLKMQELQAEYINQIKPKQAPVVEKDDLDLEIDSETLVEGKHLKKYIEEMKNLRKEIKIHKAQSQELVMQNKLKSQYPDFDRVFNTDTVEKLNQQHPSIAHALSIIPNDYDKAIAAYEMIKSLNLSEEPMKKSIINSAHDKAKAVTNSNKPRPLSSISPQQGESPLSKANAFSQGLTEELKEQLRKEMFQARREH